MPQPVVDTLLWVENNPIEGVMLCPDGTHHLLPTVQPSVGLSHPKLREAGAVLESVSHEGQVVLVEEIFVRLSYLISHLF